MPSTALLIAFLTTTAIFAFIPGPAMLYVAAQTLARGRWSGLMAALGVHLGCYVHVVAAAAGLSVLFHAVPTLYLAVKLAGAAYLVWLGIGMFRARMQGDVAVAATAPRSGRRAFVESVTVEVLNPKTALFFLAFLPQFVPAGAPGKTAALLLLGGWFALQGTLFLALLVLLSTRLSRWQPSAAARRALGLLGGTLFIALALRLLGARPALA